MILDLTPEQELFRSTVHRFLEHEAASPVLRALNERGAPFDRAWWRCAAELGWPTLLLPEDQGGGAISDAALTDLSIVAVEMGAFAAPGPLAMTSVVMSTLAAESARAACSAALESIASGASVATWAAYEPGQGWQPAECATSATRQGAGLRLTGTKDRVEYGDAADLFLVPARLDGEIVQVLVPASAAGVRVDPMWSLDFTRRFAQVTFDGVALGAEALVSRGAAAIERQCQLLLALQAAETAGATQRVFDMTLAWAFDRVSFGRVLASYQAIKHRVADMKTWLEAMHATAAAAVTAVHQASPDAGVLARAAKLFASTKSLAIMQDCVQMHGGIGVTWEHDLHLFLRRAGVNSAMYGTPQELRRDLAASLAQSGQVEATR